MLTELETGLSFLPDNEKFDKTIILKIDIDDIIPNDKNVLSTDDIDELAESIHKDGLLNPLKVYKNEDGTYELFGGHRRYLALKKLVDEDDDFDPEVSCIVYKRPADELRERLQIIQDNAQRDMTQDDRKKLFIELNNIFDTAEAEGNHAIGDGRAKADWIAVKLGISKRTLQRMRSADRISYKIIYGRCYYALHDIEEAIRNKSLYCNPQNLKELRHNFELKSRRVKDGAIG